MNFRALVLQHAGQVWQMESTRLADFLRQLDSLSVLNKVGVRPSADVTAAFDGTRKLQADIVDGVATVPIQGVILDNAPWILALYGIDYTDPREACDLLAELAANPKVKSVVLNIDSGGGSHAGTEELAAAIAAFPKPIITEARGMMASAALRIGAAANEVFASPSCLVGSIGSYIVLTDTSAADAAAGFSYTLIASGGVKGHGADGRVTDALKAEAQRIVDASSASFRAGLAADRGLASDAVAALATGAVWYAAEAQAKGLIDGVLLTAVANPVTDLGTATASPSATPTPANSTPDNSMKITAQALATLIAAASAHAAFIVERAQAGDDEATIRAACVAKDQAALVEAKTKLEADLASERAEHAKTKQALADLQAAAAKVKNFAGNAPKDPGTDETTTAVPTVTRAEHDAEPLKYRAAIRAGKIKLVD